MRGRRRFLVLALGAAAGLPIVRVASSHAAASESGARLTLFLCGDVMLGRGIDQILPHSLPPLLYETYVRDARRYLELAEAANGTMARPVPLAYVWGDALRELARRRPAARIINLETSVTRSDRPWPKGINYRMHPANVGCLAAADIDCCVLANNHVLDWEREGLRETLATLAKAGVRTAGAGADLEEAQAPAVLRLPDGQRLLVFAAATEDSGVPDSWRANASRSGVNQLPDLSAKRVAQIAGLVRRARRPGDRVVFSVHWGGNWGFSVQARQRDFAHGLIEEAGVDVVHGHSSHHVKAVEVFRDRLILYGCGDFLNDYEGIEGHAEYRGELGFMYFPTLDGAGRLVELQLVPTRIRRFRVERAAGGDRRWLLEVARREYGRFGCDVEERDDAFALKWERQRNDRKAG